MIIKWRRVVLSTSKITVNPHYRFARSYILFVVNVVVVTFAWLSVELPVVGMYRLSLFPVQVDTFIVYILIANWLQLTFKNGYLNCIIQYDYDCIGKRLHYCKIERFLRLRLA